MIPEGKSGAWAVERFNLTRAQEMMSALRDRNRFCPAGTYTQLTRNGRVIMSDTPTEIRDLWSLKRHATGNVLINGLGLGIAASLALAKPDVTSVTVIEISPDVIALVAPALADPRLTVIESDAFAWQSPKHIKYGAVWHDIWDDICADNLAEMTRLHRRYGGRADWQGSWCRAECEHHRWQNKRYERRFL